jgi:phage shock protein PspC (stress-responsive transcriptional regulator)
MSSLLLSVALTSGHSSCMVLISKLAFNHKTTRRASINVWVFGVYGKLAKQLDNFTWTLRFIWCFSFCFISENLSFFFF